VVLQAPENVTARKLLAQARLAMSQPEAALETLQPAIAGKESDPMSLLLMARAAMQSGSVSEAVAYLEQAQAARPDDYRFRLELAGAYLVERQFGSATEVLQLVPADEQLAGRRSVLLAMIDAVQGEQDAAVAELNRLVAKGALDEGAMTLAGSIYVALGELEQARRTLGSVLDEHPGNVGARLALARVDVAEGDMDAAAGQLEKVVELDAGNLVAWTGLARLAMTRNDPAAAVSYMTKAAELRPDSASVQLALVRLHTGLRQYKEAEDVARRAADRIPGDPGLVAARGIAQLMMGRTEEALATFRTAIALDEDRAESWLNLSNAQLTIKDFDGARQSLSKVIALRPDWPPALTSMALLAAQAGDMKQALELAEQVSQMAPDASEGYMLAGDFLYRAGRFGEAEQRYAAASQRGAGNAAVLRQALALQRSDLGRAQEPLLAWLESHPEDYAVRRALAQVRQAQGDSAAAIEAYESLSETGAKDPIASNNLAWLYHEAGDDRAEPMARRAYELAPDNAAIADTLAWILFGKGQFKESLELLAGAHAAMPGNPDITYHYAAALAQNGETRAAMDLLDALLREETPFPSRGEAQKLRQQLK